MSQKKINTAHFLISKFLFSPHFSKFKLCGNAQSLLRTLGDLMDTNLSCSRNRKCTVRLSDLCKQAGMTEKPARKHISKLVDLCLINVVEKKVNNISVYELGTMFSVWENLPNRDQVSLGDLSATSGDSPCQLGRISPTHIYNTAYNTSYNTVATPKSKNQKQSYTPAPTGKMASWVEEELNKHKH